MLDIYCVNKSPTCQEVGEAARQPGALECDALDQAACAHRRTLPHRRDCGAYRAWLRSVLVPRPPQPSSICSTIPPMRERTSMGASSLIQRVALQCTRLAGVEH